MKRSLALLGFVVVAVVAGAVGSVAQTVVFQKQKFFATSNAADALRSTGGYTAGSGAVPIVNTAGKIPALNSTYVADTTTLVPANLIAFTDAGACPSGWSEFTSARGRYIVGLPSGGTNLATVGTALSNTENRATGQHNHGITDPGHNHTQNAHSHGVTDPGHVHGVTDPGHNHTQNAHSHGVTDPGHVHTNSVTSWDANQTATGGTEAGNFVTTSSTSSAVTGISINNATPTNVANTTGVSINSATTGITANDATATNNATTTGITVNNDGSVGGTNAPYIQLMACKKSRPLCASM